MDEHSQAGRKGLQYANKKGLPKEAEKIFAEYPVRHTPVQWALRWLWNQPEVTCVLSGMNSEEMVLDNLETASTAAYNRCYSEGKTVAFREYFSARHCEKPRLPLPTA